MSSSSLKITVHIVNLSQFTGPAYADWEEVVPYSSRRTPSAGVKRAKLPALNLHFAWLNVSNTEIRVSALLKARSAFWQVVLAPSINSPFLKSS